MLYEKALVPCDPSSRLPGWVAVDLCFGKSIRLIQGRGRMELEPEVPVLGSNLQVLGSDQALLRALVWRR